MGNATRRENVHGSKGVYCADSRKISSTLVYFLLSLFGLEGHEEDQLTREAIAATHVIDDVPIAHVRFYFVSSQQSD